MQEVLRVLRQRVAHQVPVGAPAVGVAGHDRQPEPDRHAQRRDLATAPDYPGLGAEPQGYGWGAGAAAGAGGGGAAAVDPGLLRRAAGERMRDRDRQRERERERERERRLAVASAGATCCAR